MTYIFLLKDGRTFISVVDKDLPLKRLVKILCRDQKRYFNPNSIAQISRVSAGTYEINHAIDALENVIPDSEWHEM